MRSALVLLAIGSLLAGFGLYVIDVSASEYLRYQRNLAMCTTPLCGAGPPSLWSGVAFGAVFVLIGAVTLTVGVVRLWRVRKRRSLSSPA